MIIKILLILIAVWLVFRVVRRYLTYKRFFISWEYQDDKRLSPFVACPAVSVVVVCENEGDVMEDNLPKLLDQLGIDVEVVVVNAASTDMTSDALKRLAVQYPHLRQTYVPMRHSNLNVWEFGCLLGARASRYDWVLFVRPRFSPSSDVWLLDLLRYADGEVDAVIDYGHVTERDGHESMFAWLWRCIKMARTVLRGRALITGGGSVLVKKEWLLSRSVVESRQKTLYSRLTGDLGEAAYGDCLYLCRRYNPLRRIILRARNRRPDVSTPW